MTKWMVSAGFAPDSDFWSGDDHTTLKVEADNAFEAAGKFQSLCCSAGQSLKGMDSLRILNLENRSRWEKAKERRANQAEYALDKIVAAVQKQSEKEEMSDAEILEKAAEIADKKAAVLDASDEELAGEPDPPADDEEVPGPSPMTEPPPLPLTGAGGPVDAARAAQRKS